MFKAFTYRDRIRIREAYAIVKSPLADPYAVWPFDWTVYMSPIERVVWGDIRQLGLPFLPQYPCGDYFIDFAAPTLGVAIEVDGAEWHQDKEKDKKRDEYISAHGFKTIYRLDGIELYEDIDKGHEVRYMRILKELAAMVRGERLIVGDTIFNQSIDNDFEE